MAGAWICEYSVGWGGFVFCTVQYMFTVNFACGMMSFLRCSAVQETLRWLAAAVISGWGYHISRLAYAKGFFSPPL